MASNLVSILMSKVVISSYVNAWENCENMVVCEVHNFIYETMKLVTC